MKKNRLRLLIGGLLIVGGLLGLLQQLNLVPNATDVFWTAVLLAFGLWLLWRVWRREAGKWETLLAFILVGLALTALPFLAAAWRGVIFLFFFGLGFLAWYWKDRSWWALLVTGIFFSLAVVSALDEVYALPSDGVFLLGLGLTFALVAWLHGRALAWAWTAALVLVVLGVLEMLAVTTLQGYLLPLILILAGVVILWMAWRG